MAIITSADGVEGRNHVRFRKVRQHWSLAALLFVSLPYMGAVTLTHSGALSPIDEWVYVDYLIKLPEQGMVREGELVGAETLERLACLGVSPFGPIGPECTSDRPTDEFPNSGYSTASAYTPIYFAVTRAVGDVLHIGTGIDQLAAWRLTSLVWLAIGLFALYALLRQHGVAHPTVLTVGLLFVASPLAWWTYSYISTDAPSFAAGAFALYLGVRARESRSARWGLLVVAMVAIMIKLTNMLGIALVAVFLALEAIRDIVIDRRNRQATVPAIRRRLVPLGFAAGGLLTGLVLQFAWLAFVQSTAASSGRADQGITVTLTIDEFLLQFTNFLPGTITSSPITPYVPGFVFAPLSWVVVAGVLTAFAVTSLRQERGTIVLTVAIAAIAAAPLLAVSLYLVTGSYFQLPPRYGASILGGMLLSTAFILRSRPALTVLNTYATALLVVGLWLSLYLRTLEY